MKKFLISLLLISGVVLPCFSSADTVEDLIVKVCPSSNPNCEYLVSNFTANNSSYTTIWDFGSNVDTTTTTCVHITNFSQTNTSVDIFVGFTSSTNPYTPVNFNNKNDYGYYCMGTNRYLKAKIQNGSSPITFDVEVFSFTDLLNTALPEMTSLECQTNYNLIPISSVDQNYCTTNNLCPSQSCPDNPNVGTSNIYINDVFHPGAFNVIINIPEEIDWDYAYTSSGSNFNLDVVGYNQDTEYINGLIDINNYKPSSDDFSKVFGLFSNYGGLLVACLFVILLFYFVKKLF